MKCVECKQESKKEFCSKNCSIRFKKRESEYFDKIDRVPHQQKLSDEEIKMQKAFIKKIGKVNARKKMIISKANI